MDRCNPFSKEKAAKAEEAKYGVAAKIPPLVIPEEKNDRALPEGAPGKKEALVQLRKMHRHYQDNIDEDDHHIHAVAGEGTLGKGFIGNWVHDVAMDGADLFPMANRENLKG